MPELVRGATTPLFDRLRADVPVADSHLLATEEAVRHSIARELRQLFNTRRPSGSALTAGPEATVLDYGIPDFSSMSVHSGPDRDALAMGIADAIRWFEPRLTQTQVNVMPPQRPGGPMVVAITGAIVIGTRIQRVEFDMDF